MTDAELVAKRLALIETYLAELADSLRRAVGFRNVIVHGYASVDVAVVRDVVEHHLGDLDAFVAVVRARLQAPGQK